MIVVRNNELVSVAVIAHYNGMILEQFLGLNLPVQMKLIREYYDTIIN